MFSFNIFVKNSTTMNVLIINGPNLNLLGIREPEIYGRQSFEDFLPDLISMFPQHSIETWQSNHEGEIIDKLHSAIAKIDAIVINPGAYAHTSVAIADAIKSIAIPVVEVHLSNIHARENYRRHSFTAEACKGMISGFGLDSYRLAVLSLEKRS